MRSIIFLFWCFLIGITQAQISDTSYPTSHQNCKIHKVVQTVQNGYEYDVTICLQCELFYIVSQDYDKCLHAITQMGQQGYLSCLRIDHSGSCSEAAFGIDLIGKDEFSFVSGQVFADRCAVVDPSYLTCRYPRFGYVLDFKKQILWQDTENTFCALFDSELNKCSEYFSGFIFDEETGKTFYLGKQFIHPEKVVNNGQGFRNLQCEKDYEFIQINEYQFDIFNQKYSRTVLIGCFEKVSSSNQLEKGIKNCKEYIHNKSICKMCAKGYSLSQDRQKCKMITPNCEMFETYFGEEICSKCKPFFKKDFRECEEITNCLAVSENDQNQCIGCSQEYYLVDNSCQKSNLNVQQDCMINGPHDHCLKCTRHEEFYAQGRQCIPRRVSLLCVQKSDTSDECKTRQCKDGYVFQFKAREYEGGGGFILDQNMNQQKLFERFKIQYDNKFSTSSYIQSCAKRNNTDIKFCEKYNPIQDNCLYCQKGFEKVLKKGEQLAYECKEIKKPIQKMFIDNCLEYDVNEQFCQQCKQFYFYDEQKNKCIFIYSCLVVYYHLDQNHKNYFYQSCLYCRFSFLMKNHQSNCIYSSDIKVFPRVIEYKTIINPDKDFKFQSEPCKEEEEEKCSICHVGYVLNKVSSKCIRDIYYPNCLAVDEIAVFQDNSNKNQEEDDNNNSTKVKTTKLLCVQCIEGYVLNRGVCICQSIHDCQGTYICTDEKGCYKNRNRGYFNTTHNPNNFLKLSNKYYISRTGLFEIFFDECKIDNCEICKSSIECYVCNAGYFLNKRLKKCSKICNTVSCFVPSIVNNPLNSYPCQQTDVRFKRCIKCPSDSQYIELPSELCYDECPTDYTQSVIKTNVRVCYRCPNNCLTCTLDEAHYLSYGRAMCLACLPGKILMIGRCYDECIFFQDENNNCLEQCPLGTYVQGDRCVKQCPSWYETLRSDGQQKRCIEECKEVSRFYYPDQPFFCTKQCDEGYRSDFQNEQPRCLKCSESNCISCQEDQSKCSKCKNNYFLTEENKCRYQCSNGEVVSSENECNSKCDILYCLECSENNRFCQKCIEGFSISPDFTCICEPEKFINKLTGKCEICHPQCINCNQKDGCNECSQGFYLLPTQTSSSPLRNSINYTCTQTCPQGFYHGIAIFSSTNSNNIEAAACQKCPQVGCISCKSQTQCIDCSGKFNLKYNQSKKEYSCECKPGYFLDGDDCKFKCTNLRIVDHEKDCCNVDNCDLCTINTDICEKCNSLYPFLLENKCLRICPDGTYANNESNTCEKCNEICKTCDKFSFQCTSCSLPKSITNVKNNCSCNIGQYYYKGQCLSECPLYHYIKSYGDSIQTDQKVCESYCNQQNQEYPIFNENQELIKCQHLSEDTQSLIFCEQHASKILQLIKFELNNSEKNNNVELKISFASTPFICYKFKLRGINNFYEQIEQNQSQKSLDQFFLKYLINKQDLDDPNQVVCNEAFCYLNFEIYANNSLRLTIKIKLNILQSLVVIEGIKDPNIISKLQYISHSSIDKKQILPSFQNVECILNSYCTYKNITTEINKLVFIALNVLKQNINSQYILDIHSVYTVNKKDEQNMQPITNFYFENFSSLNTLKVIINFHKEVTGQLFIICKAKQIVNNNNQLKEQSSHGMNQNPLFLVAELHLNVKNQTVNQDLQKDQTQPSSETTSSEQPYPITTPYLTILLVFNIIICSMIFIYCLFRAYGFWVKKRSLKKFNRLPEERSESVSIELK